MCAMSIVEQALRVGGDALYPTYERENSRMMHPEISRMLVDLPSAASCLSQYDAETSIHRFFRLRHWKYRPTEDRMAQLPTKCRRSLCQDWQNCSNIALHTMGVACHTRPPPVLEASLCASSLIAGSGNRKEGCQESPPTLSKAAWTRVPRSMQSEFS